MFRRFRRGTLASSRRDRGFAIVKPCSPPETIALSLSLSVCLCFVLCALSAACFPPRPREPSWACDGVTSRRKWPELQRRMGLPTAHPNLHPGVIRWVRAGYSQRQSRSCAHWRPILSPCLPDPGRRRPWMQEAESPGIREGSIGSVKG